MSNTQVELPEGAITLPKKIQERIAGRLVNIQNITNEANAKIANENAMIIETIESFKDSTGLEGQFALMPDASALVPHNPAPATTETEAPVAETNEEATPVAETEETAEAEAPVAEAQDVEEEAAPVAETTEEVEAESSELFAEEMAEAQTVEQTHTGHGDNVAGDKIENA